MAGDSSKVLWVLGGSVLAFAVVFGVVTVRSRASFDEYKAATLEDPAAPPRWEREALDVEGCVDASMAWGLACPGVQSWCEGSFPSVVRTCLDSQDRRSACGVYGDEVLSTRFGYASCEPRWGAVEEKYEKRATKKFCALAFRVVAGYCEELLADPSPDGEGPEAGAQTAQVHAQGAGASGATPASAKPSDG